MENNTNSKIVGSLIVGLVVGFALGHWVGKSSSADTSPLDETATSTDLILGGEDTSGVRVGENALVVQDQLPGAKVVVSTIVLKDPSWVVIREDVGGKPGPRILGARKFAAGESKGEVELLRPTVLGTYYAIIHADDGDGKFDSKLDTPVTDAQGKTFMAVFHVGPEFGTQSEVVL